MLQSAIVAQANFIAGSVLPFSPVLVAGSKLSELLLNSSKTGGSIVVSLIAFRPPATYKTDLLLLAKSLRQVSVAAVFRNELKLASFRNSHKHNSTY